MNTNQNIVQLSDIQKPEQLLELIENEHVREFVALVGMSQGAFALDGRPEWVIKAASEFWRCGFGFSKSSRGKSQEYQLGFLWGMIRQLGPQLKETKAGDAEKRLISMLTSGELNQLIHSAMDNAPNAEAAEFYGGYSDGLKTPVAFSPSTPFLAYLLMTIAWRDVSKLKNTAQIHGWLEGILGANLTGKRDRIAKLLQKIRFPLTDKGGRPKGKPRKRLPS